MTRPAAARAVLVLAPGALATVQDQGRGRWAHLGVPRAGAADAPAAALANRLVGNDDAEAVLESTLGGLSVRLLAAATVAVTGGLCRVSVSGRAAGWGEPVSVRAGAEVTLGPVLAGVRCYVAFSGGVAVPRVLGSRSTDTLAWLGPPALASGQVLALGAIRGEPSGAAVGFRAVGREPLRLLPGPREDWITPSAWRRLLSEPYVVSADSDRIGLRLVGPPLERAETRELPSEGVVLGSVQVPVSGQPVVLLHDHPVTGGYPVVGVVHPADLPRCAQLAPGARVRFTLADPARLSEAGPGD